MHPANYWANKIKTCAQPRAVNLKALIIMSSTENQCCFFSAATRSFMHAGLTPIFSCQATMTPIGRVKGSRTGCQKYVNLRALHKFG